MENDAIGQAGNAAGGEALGEASNGGNEALGKAFESAMAKATETLTLTTEKGADLYALKQSVR